MKKAEMQNKKEDAFKLYLKGLTQKEIAVYVKTSTVTVSKWAKAGGWEQRRAAVDITKPELVKKLLVTINKLIDDVAASGDIALVASLPDKLSKFAATIAKLDKETGFVETVEVFMAFNKWIQYRRSFDAEITPELLIAINKYKDLYVSELLSNHHS
jgi:transcriptional regulator with XRE-family HTH domain